MRYHLFRSLHLMLHDTENQRPCTVDLRQRSGLLGGAVSHGMCIAKHWKHYRCYCHSLRLVLRAEKASLKSGCAAAALGTKQSSKIPLDEGPKQWAKSQIRMGSLSAG